MYTVFFFFFLLQVRNIIENPPCSCPVRFLVEKQPKGCYRVGEKVLYIRVSMFTLCPRNSVYIILIYNSKHIFRGQISKYRCQNPSAHVTQDVNPVLLYVKVLHIVYPSSPLTSSLRVQCKHICKNIFKYTVCK